MQDGGREWTGGERFGRWSCTETASGVSDIWRRTISHMEPNDSKHPGQRVKSQLRGMRLVIQLKWLYKLGCPKLSRCLRHGSYFPSFVWFCPLSPFRSLPHCGFLPGGSVLATWGILTELLVAQMALYSELFAGSRMTGPGSVPKTNGDHRC